MAVTNPVGWLPYGSDDASVIIQHDLCSAPTAAGLGFGGLTQRGSFSSIVHHATRGFQANGGSYNFTAYTNTTALDAGFQISVEVERKWLCWNDSSKGSDGFTPGTDEQLLSIVPTAATSFNFWLFQRSGANNTLFRAFNQTAISTNYYTGVTELVNPHSIGKSDYVTLNVGYIPSRVGGTVMVAVDGLIVAKATCNDSGLSGLLTQIYIGSGPNTRFCSTYYMRNLQISNRPPMFATHPLLQKVVLWGDSMCGTSLSYNDGIMLDNKPGLAFLRELSKRGIYVGDMKVQSNSGYTLGTYTGSVASNLTSTLATLQAENPDLVLVRAGTNDFSNGNYNLTELNSSVTTLFDNILATNDRVHLIVASVPTGLYANALTAWTSTLKANRTEISNWMRDWTPTSASASRYHFFDSYQSLGGESPAANTYDGQQDGDDANLHFAARGGFIQGQDFANAVLAEYLK